MLKGSEEGLAEGVLAGRTVEGEDGDSCIQVVEEEFGGGRRGGEDATGGGAAKEIEHEVEGCKVVKS